MRTISASLVAIAVLLVAGFTIGAQTIADKEIAARYAPVFHQALGEHPRGDYITNFDFDGDWNGTNNWANAEDKKIKLTAYIYYAVSETTSHYFIHYGVFHARDYKGGQTKGVLYSDLLGMGARILSKGEQPTGKLAEAAIAHENDMEGALVVVEKTSGNVAYVETLHHNEFSRYVPEGSNMRVTGAPSGATSLVAEQSGRAGDGTFKLAGEHVELYVEPKGHGIQAWGTESGKAQRGFLIYSYAGRAEDPEAARDERVGYDLVPIATTLWPKAAIRNKNSTFAAFREFGTITISVLSGDRTLEKKIVLGNLATAFDGKVGGWNIARPPWGWVSNDHRDDPPGLWFFDPAKIIKRDYGLGESFSTTYTKLPFWAVK